MLPPNAYVMGGEQTIMDVVAKQKLRKICKLLKSVPLQLWTPEPARNYLSGGRSYLTTTVDSLRFELAMSSDRNQKLDEVDDYNSWLSVVDVATGKEVEVYLERQNRLHWEQIWAYELTLGEPDVNYSKLYNYKSIEERHKRKPTPGILYSLFTRKTEDLDHQEREIKRKVNVVASSLGKNKLEKILQSV